MQNDMNQFLQRYNQLFINRRLSCSRCVGNMEGNRSWFTYGGFQNNVCYCCLEHICGDCRNGEGGTFIQFCTNCEKDYCEECVPMTECALCSNERCSGCMKACDDCGAKVCDYCLPVRNCCGRTSVCVQCVPYLRCENCYDENCAECFDDKCYRVNLCGMCDREFCSECLIHKCGKNWEEACQQCKRRIAPKLQEENDKLRREIEELRKSKS